MPIQTPALVPPSPPTLAPDVLRLLTHRRHPSPLEEAARILSHAVDHLVSEQLAGQCPSLAANREAIAILAVAASHLLEVERRRPAKASIAAWLRGASLSRALHQPLDILCE